VQKGVDFQDKNHDKKTQHHKKEHRAIDHTNEQ